MVKAYMAKEIMMLPSSSPVVEEVPSMAEEVLIFSSLQMVVLGNKLHGSFINNVGGIDGDIGRGIGNSIGNGIASVVVIHPDHFPICHLHSPHWNCHAIGAWIFVGWIALD